MVFFSLDALDDEAVKAEPEGKEGDLLKSFLSADKSELDNSKIIQEVINRDISVFVPEKIFEDIVKNFSLAKNLYGEKLIQLITGYDERFIEKNVNIAEFQNELRKRIDEKLEKLEEQDIIDKNFSITEKGFELASAILYMEELNNILLNNDYGESSRKKTAVYGEGSGVRLYKKGDRYRDIALRKSIRTAVKRSHEELSMHDLHSTPKENKSSAWIIYGLDASASMKGEKLEMCKKAGVALAYKAIGKRDNVGLVVFGSEVKDFIAPGNDFSYLVSRIARIRASRQTNICGMLNKAKELFPREIATKHIILLTDALPTYGLNPEQETLEAVSFARGNGVTISVVGIDLDNKGKEFAKNIALVGEGRVYLVKNVEELDLTVLEDYARVV